MPHPLDVKPDHRKWGVGPETSRADYKTMIEDYEADIAFYEHSIMLTTAAVWQRRAFLFRAKFDHKPSEEVLELQAAVNHAESQVRREEDNLLSVQATRDWLVAAMESRTTC